MKHFYRFRTWIQKVLAAFLFGQLMLDRLFFTSLDLDDIFKQGMGNFGKDITSFRSCMTIDEYNSEVSRVFHSHRDHFVFNLSSRDGHFRI
ncbi:MAG: hypothetical protein J7J85_07800 [Deltaproteobacteria bacterium]|nr:hypothetical protein [Deltaproteobacteria bacterium]